MDLEGFLEYVRTQIENNKNGDELNHARYNRLRSFLGHKLTAEENEEAQSLTGDDVAVDDLSLILYDDTI